MIKQIRDTQMIKYHSPLRTMFPKQLLLIHDPILFLDAEGQKKRVVGNIIRLVEELLIWTVY